IGRPVAGKTGTTSSNKDGWFLGFSSGLTTGVWMGRDDAKAVGGLQGGRAPARAFADFMRVAVARRPVEAFDTDVQLPDWQLEEEDEIHFGEPGEGGLVDDNGMPIELPYDGRDPGGDAAPDPPVLDRRWIDEQTGRRPSDANGGGQPKAPPPVAPPPVVKIVPPKTTPPSAPPGE
ncbi:MAG TPA: penicillin-binding protein, partial [Sphingopyxis sp.]|nr:penicillin-binding protein [Sphingopyxis sp.]